MKKYSTKTKLTVVFVGVFALLPFNLVASSPCPNTKWVGLDKESALNESQQANVWLTTRGMTVLAASMKAYITQPEYYKGADCLKEQPGYRCEKDEKPITVTVVWRNATLSDSSVVHTDYYSVTSHSPKQPTKCPETN